MDEKREIAAELDAWKIGIKKHDDQEHSVAFVDLETGIIGSRDASHILLEHGNLDLYHG